MDCDHLTCSGLCNIGFDPHGFGYEACSECPFQPERRDKCKDFKPKAPVTERERAIAFNQVEEGGGL